jgi:EAL domain-containing protein (putative c-di-GMP-specific phosphodiesterase class I)
MVNVHPRSLIDEDLYSSKSALFASRHRVILEITERDKIHEVPSAIERLARLRALGYRVAVDDLGAGYAGLNSFALIRPDIVKFDMELIRDIQRSSTKRNLVRLMTRLCKEMGILTVAEGIETGEEYDTVRKLGCDLLQGFFIARPMSLRKAAPASGDCRGSVAMKLALSSLCSCSLQAACLRSTSTRTRLESRSPRRSSGRLTANSSEFPARRRSLC